MNQKTAFTITFRGKVQSVTYTDGTLASRYIRVPALTRSHVADMGSARKSKRFGGYSNSDMFPSMIRLAASDATFAKNFDPDRMTYWGCRLHDNEVAARATFG